MERFEVRDAGDGVVVSEGELDLDAAPTLRARLADLSITTIDLAAVRFIDSSVIGVLLDAHRLREPTGGLRLRRPSVHVQRVLQLSGVDRWLLTEPT
ncbi:MAG: STAS domain-containing protein [Ilumatobacteraceae bacterium]